ncbi:MAG: aminopeptidase [Solirubrobacterales bacterium]
MLDTLDHALGILFRKFLDLNPSENVLVICNPITEELGALLRIHAQGDGGEATLMVISERESHSAELPPPVAAAMVAADLVIAPTMRSISYTAACKAATEAGTRIASMPGATAEMLTRMMAPDPRPLRERSAGLARVLGASTEAHITCPHGSDLRIGLQGRGGATDTGSLGTRGALGDIPFGEAFIAPIEGSGEGTLVVDGSITTTGKLEAPVTLKISGGRLVEASGPDGKRLVEILTEAGPEGTNLAELGIGTNDGATFTGNTIEDKKLLGTAHVAFGSSARLGGNVQVPIHLDCVLLAPTVEIDGEVILSAGELTL